MTTTREQTTDHPPRTAESRWQRWTTDMQIVVTDPDSLAAARRETDDELDAIEACASRFRPDSEINAVSASCGRPTEISALLAELLAAALEAARRTDGDVDPTVGATLVALGYDRDIASIGAGTSRPRWVSSQADWSMIHLAGRKVTVPAGVVLDLGATAKAVAADRCARRVYHASGTGVLVNLGGDIATAGTAPPGGWRVLVQDSDDDPASPVALSSGAALATSSTVRRRWRRFQDLVHHIVDPRTGLSADPVWRTVSVAAPTCVAANTVSTAAIVRGHRALDWVRAQGLPARLVAADRVVRTLGGWPADDGGEAR